MQNQKLLSAPSSAYLPTTLNKKKLTFARNSTFTTVEYEAAQYDFARSQTLTFQITTKKKKVVLYRGFLDGRLVKDKMKKVQNC